MTGARGLLAGAIIAGGQSSRMHAAGVSGDKFLQVLGPVTVIGHVAARLRPHVDQLFINANGDPARLAGLGLPVVADLPAVHGGPLVGISTALAHARDAARLLTAAADTPFLPPDLAARLRARQAETGAEIVLSASAGRIHPLFGLWATCLRARLESWLAATEKASVLAFAGHIGFETVDFAFATDEDGRAACDPFFNINRPGDLELARRLYERRT